MISAKILVAGGNFPLEIIDLINPKLKSDIVENEIGDIDGATGCILQNKIVLCGGQDNEDNVSNQIKIIGLPNCNFKMIVPRLNATSVVLNKSKIWVTGGVDPNHLQTTEKSTEIISLNEPPVLGPDLPFIAYNHSMILVNTKTIYLIGGIQGNSQDGKTWIIDPTNDFQIKEGPSLNFARSNHSCSKMRIEGRIFLVVAGGWDDNRTLDSVELLDTTCPDQGWKMGMKKNCICKISMKVI